MYVANVVVVEVDPPAKESEVKNLENTTGTLLSADSIERHDEPGMYHYAKDCLFRVSQTGGSTTLLQKEYSTCFGVVGRLKGL